MKSGNELTGDDLDRYANQIADFFRISDGRFAVSHAQSDPYMGTTLRIESTRQKWDDASRIAASDPADPFVTSEGVLHAMNDADAVDLSRQEVVDALKEAGFQVTREEGALVTIATLPEGEYLQKLQGLLSGDTQGRVRDIANTVRRGVVQGKAQDAKKPLDEEAAVSLIADAIGGLKELASELNVDKRLAAKLSPRNGRSRKFEEE